jgi:hypothetical protein
MHICFVLGFFIYFCIIMNGHGTFLLFIILINFFGTVINILLP